MMSRNKNKQLDNSNLKLVLEIHICVINIRIVFNSIRKDEIIQEKRQVTEGSGLSLRNLEFTSQIGELDSIVEAER